MYYQEEPQAVIAGYEAIIARFPHHVRAVHSLATLHGQATTAAPAYVKEVFDELAETFEEKLVTHLEYRVPWLLVDALKKVKPRVFSLSGGDEPSQWRVADVGCGTGLCGRLLRPFVTHVVGVRSRHWWRCEACGVVTYAVYRRVVFVAAYFRWTSRP